MELLPGEQADAEVKLPDDLPDESRRGQTRRVRVTLHDVKRQELPALDDAFAREVGDFDEPRRAPRRGAQGPRAARGARGRCRRCASAASTRSPRRTRSTCRRSLGAPADARRTRRRTRSPRSSGSSSSSEFHAVAETQVRRDLVIDAMRRGSSGCRATEADVDERVGEGRRGSAAPSRARCTPRCRRRGGSPELERSITEEKVFDVAASSSPQSTRLNS